MHISNHHLLYIHINTHNNYHKKVYIKTPKIFYYDTHKIIKKFSFSFSQTITISGNSINFKDKKIKKVTSTTKTKKIFNINDIDVNKILVSKKEKYGKYNSFKYFI